MAPNFCVHGKLPYILVGTFDDAFEPWIRAAELLEHLGEMVIECSFAPAAVVSIDRRQQYMKNTYMLSQSAPTITAWMPGPITSLRYGKLKVALRCLCISARRSAAWKAACPLTDQLCRPGAFLRTCHGQLASECTDVLMLSFKVYQNPSHDPRWPACSHRTRSRCREAHGRSRRRHERH